MLSNRPAVPTTCQSLPSYGACSQRIVQRELPGLASHQPLRFMQVQKLFHNAITFSIWEVTNRVCTSRLCTKLLLSTLDPFDPTGNPLLQQSIQTILITDFCVILSASKTTLPNRPRLSQEYVLVVQNTPNHTQQSPSAFHWKSVTLPVIHFPLQSNQTVAIIIFIYSFPLRHSWAASALGSHKHRSSRSKVSGSLSLVTYRLIRPRHHSTF